MNYALLNVHNHMNGRFTGLGQEDRKISKISYESQYITDSLVQYIVLWSGTS